MSQTLILTNIEPVCEVTETQLKQEIEQIDTPRYIPSYHMCSLTICLLMYSLFSLLAACVVLSGICCVPKKRPTLPFSISAPNINRFSNFFHGGQLAIK